MLGMDPMEPEVLYDSIWILWSTSIMYLVMDPLEHELCVAVLCCSLNVRLYWMRGVLI